MPELAEVEITRRKLLPLVRGRRISYFWTDWPRGLKLANDERKTLSKSGIARIMKDVRNRKILDVKRRGKVLFFELSGRPQRSMAIHLGMSGRLEITDQNDEADQRDKVVTASSFSPASSISSRRWVHFRWRLSGDKELRFIDPRKFGKVWYGSPEEFRRDSRLGRLGADANSVSFQQFAAILNGHRGAVKPFLLRQDKFSGIGNIICDESLWRAKIHPRASLTSLAPEKQKRLFHEIQKTIRAMLASGGTSLRDWGHPDGQAGGYQERRLIYGKSGQPCPGCQAKLKRIVVGGRGTTICPNCQKAETLSPKP